jgi:hypothetical protein
MKTILIPTDFDEVSVLRTHDLLKSLKNESVKIIFFHAYKITDSISDLLMLSRRTAEYGQIPESFHKACYNLQKLFKNRIALMSIEYFYGSTMAAFRNFAEAHNVSHIHYPEAYQYQKISKYSIDPLTFLDRSGIPVLAVADEPVLQENLTPELCY